MDAAPEPSLVFRPVTATNIPVIRALAERIWRASYSDMISPGQIDHMLGWMYSEGTLARELSEGVRYELAEVDGQPVAYLATSFHAASRHVELHKLYLAPELHGHGLGQAMLRHVLAGAVGVGASRVELRVNRRNLRAQQAYGRAGFKIMGEVCQDIGGGFVMDDFVMVHEIGPTA